MVVLPSGFCTMERTWRCSINQLFFGTIFQSIAEGGIVGVFSGCCGRDYWSTSQPRVAVLTASSCGKSGAVVSAMLIGEERHAVWKRERGETAKGHQNATAHD